MSVAGGGRSDPQGRRHFRVSEEVGNRNLGPQFTRAGRVSIRNGVATVIPPTSPEAMAAASRADRQKQAEAKASQDRAADSKRMGLAKKRYRSALAAGKSPDEAYAAALKTHKGFKPPAR